MRIHPFSILLIFIAVPLIEIFLLIQLGSVIGVLPTIGIVIATAVIGTTLLRSQGFGVLMRVNESMQSGKVPVVPVMEGLLLLVAGAFLLTPGLLTDATGFALLVPFIRQAVAATLVRKVLKAGLVHVHASRGAAGGPGGPFAGDDADDGAEGGPSWPGGRPRGPQRSEPGGRRPSGGDETIIEGEYERLDERTRPPDRDRE